MSMVYEPGRLSSSQRWLLSCAPARKAVVRWQLSLALTLRSSAAEMSPDEPRPGDGGAGRLKVLHQQVAVSDEGPLLRG